jgi:hypothetical protein
VRGRGGACPTEATRAGARAQPRQPWRELARGAGRALDRSDKLADERAQVVRRQHGRRPRDRLHREEVSAQHGRDAAVLDF